MFAWLLCIVIRLVDYIVRMGCTFLGWNCGWLRLSKDSYDQLKHDSQLQPVQHLGVLFTDRNDIKLPGLASLLQQCHQRGVRRVTLFDPWDECVRLRTQLEKEPQLEAASICASCSFPELDGCEFAVQLLGADSSRNAVVEAIKENLRKESNLKQSDIDERLEARGISEPELLLKIGDLPTMLGYPPLALRVTEIVTVARMPTSPHSFGRVLYEFSRRDRRLGK